MKKLSITFLLMLSIFPIGTFCEIMYGNGTQVAKYIISGFCVIIFLWFIYFILNMDLIPPKPPVHDEEKLNKEISEEIFRTQMSRHRE